MSISWIWNETDWSLVLVPASVHSVCTRRPWINGIWIIKFFMRVITLNKTEMLCCPSMSTPGMTLSLDKDYPHIIYVGFCDWPFITDDVQGPGASLNFLTVWLRWHAVSDKRSNQHSWPPQLSLQPIYGTTLVLRWLPNVHSNHNHYANHWKILEAIVTHGYFVL